MEREIDKREKKIQPPKRWTEKFFECKDLNKELNVDPTSLSKEPFWQKPDHNELDKDFKRQIKGKNA